MDSKGHIYTVEPDGRIHWRAYDPAAKKWEHRILTGGWAQYDLIVAAGDGVIYARKPDGSLYRSVYNASTSTWTQQATYVDNGWDMFGTIMSVGGDILYGARPDNGGELLWYRYFPGTNTWANSGIGKVVGQGWYNEYNITAPPDGCRLIRWY